MIQIPIKFKRGRWYIAFLANFLTPALLAFFSVEQVRPSAINNSPWTYGLGAVGLIFLLMVIYSWAVSKEFLSCKYVVKKPKVRMRNMYMGMLFSFLSWNVFLIIACCGQCISNSTSSTAFKIVSYVAIGVTAILSAVANIFFNMFELTFEFDIFNKKYRESVIKQTLANIDYKNSILSRKTTPQYK